MRWLWRWLNHLGYGHYHKDLEDEPYKEEPAPWGQPLDPPVRFFRCRYCGRSFVEF